MTTQPILSPVAIANADILRVMAESGAAAFADHIALAAAADRPVKNMDRTLQRLADAGLVEGQPGLGWAIAPAGRQALAGIDVAEGRAPAPAAGLDADNDVLLLRHDQLAPNPAQPRKTFDEQKAEELKASIVGAGDVLQNLVVFPADDEGRHAIFAGERRWRAVGELIAEGMWAADRRLRCIVKEPTPGRVAFIGLVENGQGQRLTLIEEARAYQALVAETGWSARNAALQTGRDPRTVQEMLRVLEKAEPDLIAQHEADPEAMPWERLRKSVRERREEDAPTEGEQIDLVVAAGHTELSVAATMLMIELAWKTDNDPVYRDDAGAWANVSGYSYLNDAWKEARDAGLARDAMPAIFGRLCCIAQPTQAGRNWLAAVFGEITNEVVEAFRAEHGRQEREPGAGVDEGYFAETLNDRIGARSQQEARQIWQQPSPDLLLLGAEIAHKMAMRPLAAKTFKGGIAAPRSSDQDQNRTWLHWSGLIEHNSHGTQDSIRLTDRGAEWLEQHLGDAGAAARMQSARERAGFQDRWSGAYFTAWLNETPEASEPKAPATESPAKVLSPVEALAMTELAYVLTGTPAGTSSPAPNYWLDACASDLAALNYIRFSHAGAGPSVLLQPAGRAWLNARFGDLVTAADVAAAQDAASAEPAAGCAYVTPWLNAQEAVEPPADLLVQGKASAPSATSSPAMAALLGDGDDEDQGMDEDALDELFGTIRAYAADLQNTPRHWSRSTGPDLAARAVRAVLAGDPEDALYALMALMVSDDAGDPDKLLRAAAPLFTLQVGDQVTIGGTASAYRLIDHARTTDRDGADFPAFTAQQVSLKTGKDYGAPRQVTLHAIQGVRPAKAGA